MLNIDIDKWQEIYATLSRHKLRTFLTAFGVFWGIFMLVILLGAGKGLENGVMSGFGGMKNSVILWAGGATSIPYEGLSKGRRISMKDGDVDAIREQVKGVDWVIPKNGLGSKLVKYQTKNDFFTIEGGSPEVVQLRTLKLQGGRGFNIHDMIENRKTAIIGNRVREVLFPNGEDPIGKYIDINGIYFQIVGAFEPGRKQDAGGRRNLTEYIYIPTTTLRRSFNQMGWIGTITVTPLPGYSAIELEKRVLKLIKERHKVHPDDPTPFGSYNVEKDFRKFQSLFAGVSGFSWLVAIGTIFAGVIGVGNIMLIVVKERTKEIGVRKSLGATPMSIVAMVVQEALVITSIAGYLGLVCGVFVLEGVVAILQSSGGDSQFFKNPEVGFSTAAIAIVVLIVSGCIASLLPAAKAAKIDPVVALQTE